MKSNNKARRAMKKNETPAEMDHDFVFCDSVEKAEEIIRTYTCPCGARKVEVFSLTKESITPGKEKSCES